jgi:hypothetical protein
MPEALYTLVIFQIRSHDCAQAGLNWVGPSHMFHAAGMTGAHHHIQLLIEMGSHGLFAQAGLKP